MLRSIDTYVTTQACCPYCTLYCSGKRSSNFVVGLTNDSPVVSRPTLWNYTLCGQYPGRVPNGGTVSLHCRDNLPGFRYVIVQIPRQDALNVCEIQVHVRGMSKIFTARGIIHRVRKKVPSTFPLIWPHKSSAVAEMGDRFATIDMGRGLRTQASRHLCHIIVLFFGGSWVSI